MRRIERALSVAAAALALGAAAGAQSRAGSIYDPSLGPRGMIADKTARRPGDLLTVVISESQDVQNEESSTLNKQTTLDYALTSFDLKPSLFDPLPNLTARSEDGLTGTANYQKTGTFQARITVLVMDALPNGNLVISGRREIRVDQETKLIEFSGIVRRYDIAADNTIQSELVAQARISYVGDGPLTRSTNRYGLGGLFHRVIAWLWPF
jgi:flagellar L-ring protein precursor FlgH